jgi:hypothetical protein
MATLKILVALLEDILGTASANPKIHEEYIGSKSADADKLAEELAALPKDEAVERSVTVFPRDTDDCPILFDYQFKGFLKEVVGILLETEPTKLTVGKSSLSKWTYKKLVDNYVMVSPRKIRLAPVGEVCVRPLRADTMRGERIALASSETVPAGTQFEVIIETFMPAFDPLIRRCLDYGRFKGLGQWRNSGKGRFEWTEL